MSYSFHFYDDGTKLTLPRKIAAKIWRLKHRKELKIYKKQLEEMLKRFDEEIEKFENGRKGGNK